MALSNLTIFFDLLRKLERAIARRLILGVSSSYETFLDLLSLQLLSLTLTGWTVRGSIGRRVSSSFTSLMASRSTSFKSSQDPSISRASYLLEEDMISTLHSQKSPWPVGVVCPFCISSADPISICEDQVVQVRQFLLLTGGVPGWCARIIILEKESDLQIKELQSYPCFEQSQWQRYRREHKSEVRSHLAGSYSLEPIK